ncbi:LysE family translocator [Pseudoalteromonas luteoviolacea]|uniref:LysE family translocator n=1 Tax=Pseudoalteromonas luteoviolacea TaxID=43657 RepID=UPI001B398154|nr:LysE family translocator [Pseudoalteromonas luteoviolacea]MBQ4811177.1 LysE family translocator [Pseudoalteromonas luteoviolacea]
MPELTILPLFLITTLLLAISPGPDLVLISAYSSGQGFKSGVRLALGIFIAGIVQTLAVALGLGQLMQQFPPIVTVIKLLGALYLAWLGVNMLKSWWLNKHTTTMNTDNRENAKRGLVLKGFLNNLMNPKALLFFSVFLVQFTHGNASLTSQILVLGTLLSTVVLFVNLIFAFSFSKLGKVLAGRFRLGHHFDGVLGALFLALAARLATSK